MDGGHRFSGSVVAVQVADFEKIVKNAIFGLLRARWFKALQAPETTAGRCWAGSELAWGHEPRPHVIVTCFLYFYCSSERDIVLKRPRY